MYCQRLVTLLAASLSLAPAAVLATPSFRFVQGGLVSQNSPSSQSSPSSPSSVPHSNSTGSTSTTSDKPKGKISSVGRDCGSHISLKLSGNAEKKLQTNRVPASSNKAGPVKIPVYFHVIAANQTEDGGYLSKETIDKQMQVMNDAFDLALIDFELVNITYTINPKWFNAKLETGHPLEHEVKSALRQGDAGTLNVYTAELDLLGFATFPFMYDEQPELDGVVIDYASVPGGRLADYDLGATLVHESGHWFGLYHTFQGESCDGPGDYVSDTPQQSVASRECTPSDSCSNNPGSDPYTNYMDYSPDACLSEFTTGQIRRMRDEIRTYRGIDA